MYFRHKPPQILYNGWKIIIHYKNILFAWFGKDCFWRKAPQRLLEIDANKKVQGGCRKSLYGKDSTKNPEDTQASFVCFCVPSDTWRQGRACLPLIRHATVCLVRENAPQMVKKRPKSCPFGSIKNCTAFCKLNTVFPYCLFFVWLWSLLFCRWKFCIIGIAGHIIIKTVFLIKDKRSLFREKFRKSFKACVKCEVCADIQAHFITFTKITDCRSERAAADFV